MTARIFEPRVRGYCSECGVWLERTSVMVPLNDPGANTIHSHSRPWRLLPAPQCPDCGNDPKDDSLHAEGCRRLFNRGDPREELQYGPPWLPWREAAAAVKERTP